jgi:type VI secretion system protein ImpL
MRRFLRGLLSTPVLGTLAMLALSCVLWWVGPLVAVGSVRPLEGVGARVAVLAVLWLAWIGRLAWTIWRRRRASAALMAGIAAPSAADREAEVLAERFRQAVAKLKTGGAGRPGWFSGRDALYAMPWYVFVGAPGSGKTTALLNAGLNFVFEQKDAAVQGLGGTRNCDWWFTHEAVLIDTAGRYALQESDQQVDASAWDRFLTLLRKTRPRRPINGVLLTVNVQDLLQQGAPERTQHAAKLRARLHELQSKLGVRPPVYVMVTKADLVAGFAETFEALGKEARDQVWGFSFDPATAAADQPLRDFDAEYRLLVERLAAGLPERLQAERDTGRRAAMFGFVQEFASLQPVLGEFLAQVFGSGGTLQDRVLLRGVYFTSGTQEGTPIDRVMGVLSRSFGLERHVASAPGAQQRGRSYFLRRLLQDVAFPESHLVSFNPRAERRRTALRVAGFSTVAVAATAMVVGWAVSWSRNQAYEREVAARLPALQQAVDALPPATSADLAPLVPVLDPVRRAAEPQGFAVSDPPLLNTLGLYQGDKLDAGAQTAYRRLLANAMLPRVAQRQEERLRAAGKDNLEQAYEALKAYVMLHTPGRLDPEALKAWIAIDWDSQLKHLSTEQRAALDRHLDALLAEGAPQPAAPMDAALVGSVRDLLASFPLEYRVYSRLKRQYRGEMPEFSVAATGGPHAPRVFARASGEPLSRGVSGFYTRDGYARALQAPLTDVAVRLAAEESWVLGRGSNVLQAAVGQEVSGRVKRLYLQDYVKAWDAYLADVRLVRPAGLDAGMEVARILAAIDSPLAAYLRAAARETTLVPPPRTAGALDKLSGAAQQARNDMARLADPQQAAAAGGPLERLVDDHFAGLHRSVQGQPAPIDDVARSFGDVHAYLQSVDRAQKSKSAPPPPPAAGGGAAALPDVVRAALDDLVDVGAQRGRAAEREVLTTELKPLYDHCMRAIANRYPFAAGSSADVLLEDFGDLFGVGGKLDEFYQRRLAALVDTGAATWRYKPAADGTRPASPAALVDFQRAARIKDVFFRGGGRAPALRMDLRVAELGGGLSELTLDVDGQVHRFTAAGGAPVSLAWPNRQVKVSAAGGVPMVFEGPWALFRLFDRFQVQPSPQPERFDVLMNLDGKPVRLQVTTGTVFNPFRLREIQQFRCPGAL